MTAEEIQAIYYAVRSKAMQESVNYSKPVVQHECDMMAWQAVADLINDKSSPRASAHGYPFRQMVKLTRKI